MIRTPARRGGFTLLEVLLASAIAVLLLGGLYVAFDLTLTRADFAREEAARADLARAVVNRLALDLAAPLGPLPPRSGGGIPQATDDTAAATTGATTTTGTTSSTTTTTGTGTPAATTDPTATTSDPNATDAPEAMAAADVPFQAGVIGTESQVTLFTSRVPAALTDPAAAANVDAVLPADLRRVTFYVGTEGGLCRQERAWVTADGVRNSTDPDRSDESADLLAPEVTAALFEYFDGTSWQTSWDGSAPSSDGTSVMGPPRAIRATLTFEFPERDGRVTTKRVQQVFAVRSAPGVSAAPPPVADDTTTDPAAAGTTTGGM